KVTDVTTSKQTEVSEKGKELLSDKQEVKKVYDIKLLQDGKEVQPDETLKIKIPYTEEMANAILVRQKKDGTYEKLNVSIENGYLVYESDELGIVAIIADKENPDKEVQGSYYPGSNTGGALTGDTTSIWYELSICFTALGCILFILSKKRS
ncbi:MAG: hypothetical protein HFE67_06305, partial [Erysipelotrichaceae bacterium]|nr:hypothetical protein [Erysipelotrichaceae bacterium]